MKKPLSLYWKCQLIGWSVASLYWGFMGYIGTNFSIFLAVIHFFGDLLIYILPTHLFRNFSVTHRWHTLRPKPLLIRLIPAVVLLGLSFMVLTIGKTYLIRLWFEHGFSESFQHYSRNAWLTTFVTGIRLMSIWVLAYYLYHYAQREINATKQSARLALIAKEAQLNQLTAQLNPHFFFNSLNNIKALVLEEPHKARRAIDLLSDLLRTSLYRRDTVLISVQEEMALITDYLELEKMRFEKRLQTAIEIEEQLSGALILPLSIQTLVENAIKHGISQRKSGGLIFIKVEQKAALLYASVQNPGSLKTAESNGLGIKNLKERLQLQFNGKAAFELKEQADETVLATLIMPLV
ncbi:MAG: histidine kinase [Spirosomataceae bacterium]